MHAELIKLRIDEEFKKIIPPLTDEEYQLLHESIDKNGCLDPIIVWGNTIIDGHNRYSICQLLGIPYSIKEISFNNREEAMLWIIQHQIGKRNLEAAQKIELAMKMKPLIALQAKDNQKGGGGSVPTKVTKPIDTREELARIAGVSPTQISKWDKIVSEASAEDLMQLRSGKTTIHAVHKKLLMKEQNQTQLDEASEKQVHILLKDIHNRLRKLSEMPQEILLVSKEQLKSLVELLTVLIDLDRAGV